MKQLIFYFSLFIILISIVILFFVNSLPYTESTISEQQKHSANILSLNQNHNKDKINQFVQSNSFITHPKKDSKQHNINKEIEPNIGEWIFDGEVMRGKIKYGDKIFKTTWGVPGGSERGYNLYVQNSPYLDYDDETLISIAEQGDKIAELLIGNRLLNQDGKFKQAQEYLVSASKKGYTAGYDTLRRHYYFKSDFIKAYSFQLLMAHAGDEYANSEKSIGYIATKHLTNEQIKEAKSLLIK